MLYSVFNIGGGEILVVLLIAMVVLGPERLPKAARDIGRAIAEFRRITTGVQSDLKDAMGAEEFRESMESLRSVVDLRSSIKGELQGLTSSLTASINDTASTATYGSTSIPDTTYDSDQSPGIPAFDMNLAAEAQAETDRLIAESRAAAIPPPDGMFVGDAPAPTLGDQSIPTPSFSYDDIHPSSRAHDSRPRLGALDSYDR